MGARTASKPRRRHLRCCAHAVAAASEHHRRLGGTADCRARFLDAQSGFKRWLVQAVRLAGRAEDRSLDRGVLWEICQEVWDAIPVEVLRPYLLKTEERCKKIKEVDGAWVGWGKGTNVRHGMQV